jgi:hypothetical protein
MNVPAIVTVSATMPLFAAIIGEEKQGAMDDVIAVLYVAAIGLMLSFAALFDDLYDLTSWFGLLPPDGRGFF